MDKKEIYYQDHGSGLPVVLVHGWPLNGDAWEKQTPALLAAGHRVMTYDRRGFGRSSKPGIGYNYNTFAVDLDALLNALNLTDVSLVGHSMGTGEVTRYIGKYGTKRLRKAVLIGTLGPYLVKAPDNPEGVDAKVFDEIRAGIRADRPVAMMEFLKNFYSVAGADGKLVSERAIEANWTVAIGASPIGTLACVDAWLEDFRKDIARNDLPTLLIHGDDDRILPPDAASRRQAPYTSAAGTLGTSCCPKFPVKEVRTMHPIQERAGVVEMPAANLVMAVNGMEKIEVEREMTEPRLTQCPQLSRSRLLVLCAAASLAIGLVNIPLAQCAEISADDVIKRAQAAMGGADLKSVHIKGVGPGSLFGQAYEPGFVWPKIIYTSLTRVLDFEHEAYREDAARSRAELLGGGATPPFGQGDLLTIGFLKDGVSWNTAGPFVGLAPALLEARVNDLWTTSPHGAILAAKKFGATAESKQLDGQSFSTLSFTIPRKMSAVVWVNSAGFVTRIDSKVPSGIIGDMDVTTQFEEYRGVGSLKYPMRLRQSAAGTEVFDITMQDVKVDVPAKIDMPEGIRGAKPKLDVQKVADGVWFLEGPTHNSVAVEMTDQIVLVESPISDGYAEQIFLAANALAPGKKVGTAIATHHHFDHVGGLRYAASQGATIVASSMALPYYEKIFSNPSLIAPDRLATSGQKAAFVGVDDFKVISDDNQRVEIHQIRDSLHSKGFLMVYLPKIRILIEADLFQISHFTNPAPTSAARPALPVGSELNLIENLDRLKLNVDTILPLHSHTLTERELRVRAQSSIQK